MTSWRALTPELEPAAAEVLSEALLEAGAQSVVVDLESGRPRVMALLGPAAEPGPVLREAARIAGQPEVSFRLEVLPDEDWVRRSQAQFEPVSAGRLWIGAGWHEPPRQARAVVRLDPGLAFGTGSHASTRLMLQLVDDFVHGGESVLDYGCGSGILAIAAAKLGAAAVDAVDLDPVAVETTAANARRNGAAVRTFAPESLPQETYRLVLANILCQPLVVLAPLLASRTSSTGRIALAGILESQVAELSDAYRPWFDLEPPRLLEGWALVTGVRH